MIQSSSTPGPVREKSRESQFATFQQTSRTPSRMVEPNSPPILIIFMPLFFTSEFHPLVIRSTDWLELLHCSLSLAHRVQGPFHLSTYPSCAHPPSFFFPTVSRRRCFFLQNTQGWGKISLTADGSWLTYRVCVCREQPHSSLSLPPFKRETRIIALSLSLSHFSPRCDGRVREIN